MHRFAFICLAMTLSVAASFAVEVDPNGAPPAPEWHSMPVGTTWADALQQYPQLDVEQTNIDPGEVPEGDYMGSVAFTRDGNRVFLSNRLTNNIDVFDAHSYVKLATIDVGTQPCYMDCSDAVLVVSCSFSDEVYVINLDDYSIAAIFDTQVQPWRVHVNTDGTRAYVACDIENNLEVFDLTNLTHIHTWPNFPVWLSTIYGNSESGRTWVSFTDFQVVPFTDLLMVADGGDNIFFFNGLTGTVDYTITGVGDVRAMDISGDMNMAVAVNTDNPVQVHQITLNTYHIIESYTIPGVSASFYGIGCNFDGTKAYLGVSNNQSALVDFEDNNHVFFTDTYTAFWVGTSYDHLYAISGQYRFTLINFNTESIAGSYWGYSQYGGETSPAEYRAIGIDPMSNEGLYSYNFTNPGSISFNNSMVAGTPPEADAPRRAAIAPNGQVAVISNVISDNVTILNLQTGQPVAYLPIGDRVQDVAITHDSHFAVVCCYGTNSVFIIDLQTNQIVADVPAGGSPGVVAIHPDDSYAYVGNILSNTVSQIALLGAASYEVTERFVGELGVVWAAYGVLSDVRVSPDGNEVLAAASFDDLVYVLDANSLALLTTIPTGDFPIQLAFDASGDHAIATNYFSDNFTLMNIDGANSTLFATLPAGDGPLRCGYNPSTNEFGIGNFYAKTVSMVDAATGVLHGTQPYAAYGYLIGVDFMNNGDRIVLTSSDGVNPGHLHTIDGASVLPASPSYYGLDPAHQKVLVAMPGPDWVSLFEWDNQLFTLGLIPDQGTTIIPAGGGTVEYDAAIGNNAGQTVHLQGWTRVTLPNGNTMGPLALAWFWLAPGAMQVNNLAQNVPAMAPAGQYTFHAFMGRFNPGIVAATDSFPFQKLASGTTGAGDWYGTGLVTADLGSEAAEPPFEYDLEPVYPNPFNSTTVVRVSLPGASELNLAVFNVTGQKVLDLSPGRISAGEHSFTVDASGLASGVYFVRATVPFTWERTRKLILLR